MNRADTRTRWRPLVKVRLLLAALCCLAGTAAALTSEPERYRDFSDAATVVMLGLVVLLLLTGLFQPTEPHASNMPPGRAGARAVGRRIRAAVAASGVALFAGAIIADTGETLTSWALFAVLASLSAPPLALVWWRVTASPGEVHAWRLTKSTGVVGRRRVAGETLDAAATPQPRYEELVAPGPGGRAVTIGPRPQLPPHGHLPWGTGAWLRNAAITADASSVSVTDAAGRVRTLPRAAAPGQIGVARLAICREEVSYRTQYGWSAPQRTETLTLLTPDRQRLLDLDLYGWTGTDLRALATTSGLGLERFWYDKPNLAVPRLTGLPATPLQRWLPRAVYYDQARGRARWPRVLGITAGILGAMAALGGIGLVGVAAHATVGGSLPWLAPVATGVAFAVLVGALPGAARRADIRRRERSAYVDAV